MTIDEELTDILNNADWFADGTNPSGDEDRDRAVQLIKQVFIDHKYCYHEQMLLKQFLELGKDNK